MKFVDSRARFSNSSRRWATHSVDGWYTYEALTYGKGVTAKKENRLGYSLVSCRMLDWTIVFGERGEQTSKSHSLSRRPRPVENFSLPAKTVKPGDDMDTTQ